MSEENNILIERLSGVTKLINEKFETNAKQHNDILDQQKKTNGRVLVNDNRISNIEAWKNKIIGAILVMNIVLLPVIFIIVKNWLVK